MTTIFMKDIEIHTYGELPSIGSSAPSFNLVSKDLESVSLSDYKGKPVLINVYPSIDTQVCFSSVKQFSQSVPEDSSLVILCVSMDLPFALSRAASEKEFDHITFLSDYCNRDFGANYGLTIADGPIAGMLARAVILLDYNHEVSYHELVKDVTTPPDYQAVLAKIK